MLFISGGVYNESVISKFVKCFSAGHKCAQVQVIRVNELGSSKVQVLDLEDFSFISECKWPIGVT